MFRTEISLPKPRFTIDIKTSLVSLGSCFANDIGKQLQEHKFDITINPGGILFNPFSIFELIALSLNDRTPEENTFLNQGGLFLNYKLHSEVNASSQTDLIDKIHQISSKFKASLKQAKLIIITFGTAWVYKLKEDDTIVANCHKVPQSQFSKALLTKEEIVEKFNATKELIQAINPDVKFLLTVSPVRHIKDSLPLNSVSKATLRLACHELREAHAAVDYFPSYEILMDDLRGYRFYKKDMLHPNEQAIEYIWQKFADTYFTDDTVVFVQKWQKLKAAMQHKPFHPASKEHQHFLKDLIQKIENLSQSVDVSQEVSLLKSQLL